MRPEIYYPLLMVAGFGSGFVDSIAGGGGLISLPALMLTGMPDLAALATNKLAGTYGSFTSSARYLAAGQVEPIAWPIAGIALAGSAAGASLATLLRSWQLNLVVTVALIVVGIFVAFRKDFGQFRRPGRHGIGAHILALVMGLGIGFYDGLIGPGTGTFLAFVFITVLGLDFLKATGSTKVVNFATNAAALATFVLHRAPIHYVDGCVMGTAILTGAFIGSGLAVKIGPKFIRPLFVVVAAALAVKLVINTFYK